MKPTYRVYISDRSDVATASVAALLASALSDLGYQTVFPAPGLPEAGPDRVNLVVGPNEFFPLQDRLDERDLLRAAEASVVVGVGPAGAGWSEAGLRYASAARAVVDIHRHTVDDLRLKGLSATHLQLGYHPSWDRWGGDPARARPIDLLFQGALTPRRERTLAQDPILWDGTTKIRLFEAPQPGVRPRDRPPMSTERWDLLASSRILLNVHWGDAPDLDWVSVIEAMANGCMVVTECSSDYGPLLPRKHLIAAPAHTLNAYAVSLMADEELRSGIATAAYDLLRSELRLTSLLEPVCARVEELALGPAGQRPPVHRDHPGPRAGRAPTHAERTASRLDEASTRARVHVKHLLDGETELIQQVDALAARRRYGGSDHADVQVTRAWKRPTPPLISVILTSYNYRNYIPQTIASVIASVGVDVELIIVDDRSDDNSVAVVRGVMSRHDWFPIKLMARAANVGQSLARNMGITQARGEFLFILNSDNMIYPTTLKKLSDALTRAPDAAFSYGIIVKSDHSGLLSQLPWSVERLCIGNYIDAMTMQRRSILEEVGGFRSFWGWEDYELWCRLASRGHRAEFVPEIVGWYRFHSSNAIHTTNLDIARLARELRTRYPSLPWMAEAGA